MKNLIWNDLNPKAKREILKRPELSKNRDLTNAVSLLIEDVRINGDNAVRKLTERFDTVSITDFKVSPAEINFANSKVSENVKNAFRVAINNIEIFHKAQEFENIKMEVMEGVECQQVSRAIQKVGLYVPGGTAPLPSTVFMLAIPARIAGCETRILCTPPRKDGSIDPNIIVAATMVGITDIYKIGGVQAIAAMAYGTESIVKVDKIFGPGNSWVTEAKVQVSSDPGGAACDMPAGPSEVLVIADESANPEFVAIDLLSQAEHGKDSQVILVSNCEKLIKQVGVYLGELSEKLNRREIIQACLENSRSILANSLDEAITISEIYAPEHLILQIENPDVWVDKINNAGSVFLGPWTPESVGDYASGTNHVLPTFGYARSLSGLNLDSFYRKMTIQKLSQKGILDLGPVVERMAEVEGLEAHKMAVTLRLNQLRAMNLDLTDGKV